jgi:hypothetical protein
MAGDRAIVCIDESLLADGDILGLRLRDFELCLQARRLRDARKNRSRRNLLYDL